MSRGRRATLNDLAETLGLSANTVSRALTGKDGVSLRTRELVLQEAERIGYAAPSTGPRSTSRTIALTVTSSTNVFISHLIPAVEAALRPLGYSVVIRVTEESTEIEESVIAAMMEGGHAGAIVIPVQGEKNPWAGVEFPFPLVAVAREIQDVETDFVAMDSIAAMYAVARHVLTSGARSLIFFDEDLDISTNRARIEGFESAVKAFPDATGRIVAIPTRRFESRVLPWQPEEGYRSVMELLDRGTKFDAMLFEDDYFALGALRALHEHGIRVPDDVQVVGYGNHPYSAFLSPSLTTVSVPSSVIAEAAVSMLLQRIAGDQTPPIRRLVPAELVVRESSVKRWNRDSAP